MSSTSSKISQFMSRTGSSHKVAQELLKENHWNVDHAVNVYKLMNEVSVMPMKNSNLKQNVSETSCSLTSVGRHTSHDHRATNKVKPTQDYCKNSAESLTASYRSSVSTKGKQKVTENHAKHPSESLQELKAFNDTIESTFILPDFSPFPDDFRNFLDKDLIETSTLELLMKAGRLNWWSDLGCQPLFPLVTTGDGNCLLHAASLALWGHQDQELILRKKLYDVMLNSPYKEAFFRRWKWYQMQINKQSELVYDDQEWSEEWNNLVKLASHQPRISSCTMEISQGLNSTSSINHQDLPNGSHHNDHHCQHQQQHPQHHHVQQQQQYEQQEIQYESLEELHIFVLAHLLHRPIIITADTILRDSSGEALAPITFGGVYLPLECPPAACYRFPILLTYDAAHFSALVPMEDSFQTSSIITRGNNENCAFTGSIPLVDCNLELLPVHFVRDPGPDYKWNGETPEDIQPQSPSNQSQDNSTPVGNGGGHCSIKNGSNNDKVSLTEKVAALKKYLDIEVVPLVALANSFSSLDSNELTPLPVIVDGSERVDKNGRSSVILGSGEFTDINRTSETLAKRTSNMGDNANGFLSNSKNNVSHLISNDLYCEDKTKRDNTGIYKNKGLGRLRKIAKSMSANFKKSFNVKGSLKHSGKCADVNTKEKQISNNKATKPDSPIESVEPNNVIAFIVESLEKKTRVPCAKLLYKRQDYQNEIIRTYLEQASERFILNRKRELERLQTVPPLMHHSSEKPVDHLHHQQVMNIANGRVHPQSKVQTSPVQCINAGCNGKATSDTSYLCVECYEKQKNEEAKMKNNNNNNNLNNNNSVTCDGNFDVPENLKNITKPNGSSKSSNSRSSLTIQDNDIIRNVSDQKSTKNIASSVNNLKSSISDEFKSNSPGIVLEKYTKIDNRMLVATETTQAEFDGSKAESGCDENSETFSKTNRNDPGSSKSDHHITKVNLNRYSGSKQGPQISKSLLVVEEFEKQSLTDRKNATKNTKCLTEGCKFYGSQLTDQFCSSCHKKRNIR